MNTADLITSFFNNELSPDQERQFLLSVASSDSLRLGLKSHVMLDKILYEESSLTMVPSGVRTAIMKEAAVVAAAAAGSALAANQAEAGTADSPDPAQTKPTGGKSLLSVPRRFFRWSSAALILLFSAGGFFAGFYTGTETGDNAGQMTTQEKVENNPIVSPPASVGSNPASSSVVSTSVTSSDHGVPTDVTKSPTIAGRKAEISSIHTSAHDGNKREEGSTVGTSIPTTAKDASSTEGSGQKGGAGVSFDQLQKEQASDSGNKKDSQNKDK